MSCVYLPSKGVETFRKLKKEFGRKVAQEVYSKITGTDFQRLYGDFLALGEEGVPTFDSIMKIQVVRDFIGELAIINGYLKQLPIVEDTLQNTSILIDRAADFNNSHNDSVAIVNYTNDGKITLDIVPRTEESLKLAAVQRNIQKLNERAAELLASAGISLDVLSNEETSVGRVGVTNFTRAKNLADGFTVLMAVANNMEGANAISEEFAHFIIGVYRNKPLVTRGINYCKNLLHAREILGDEYDNVYEFYNGNTDLIAEEAAGHILKEALLDKINNTETIKEPLFRRMVNFIINLFKGLNPAFYQNSIDSVVRDFSTLALEILTEKRIITKQDIQKAKRIAAFNALSERVKVQILTLKDIVERVYKSAALLDNLDEIRRGDLTQKSEARRFADKVQEVVKKYAGNEESMAAVAAVLSLALLNIEGLFEKINNLEGRSAKDKFTILRNALYTILSYSETIDKLEAITTDEYMIDEDISGQSFMVEDFDNTLSLFEVDDTTEPLDTSGKTTEEVSLLIQLESNKWHLSEDESHYVNDSTGEVGMRVTATISADKDGEAFDENSPWATPSTNIGTGVDEFTRDFFNGKIHKESDGTYTVNGKLLDEVYPNATKEALTKYAKLLEELLSKFRSRGITLIARDVIANGTIETIDGTGKVHTISVAGTLDILGYDASGNWYIYDMKTHRGVIDTKKENKWRRQLTLYKKFLENKYGIRVKEMGIIPILVEYPTPEGCGNGTAKYTVSNSATPAEYNGSHNNLLLIDGNEFREANPNLDTEIRPIKSIGLNILYSTLANDPTNGMGGSGKLVMDAVHHTRELYGKFTRAFSQVAIPEFLNFLKPFVGENIRIADEKNKGKMKTVSIRSILEESKGDVSIMLRWFTSMADNPDAILQIFDKVVKRLKDEHRIKTIEKALEILALGKKYEKLGITSYEWMYESDKRNYINKVFDRATYDAAKAEKTKELDTKYGKHPTIGSDEYRAKKLELRQWVKDNTKGVKDERGSIIYIPDPETFPSKYKKLSLLQKDFYDEWMSIKADLDNLIGSHHTTLTNTIKIRKSGIERIKGSLSGDAISNFVESVKAKALKSFDDDITYKDAKGIRGFDGREVMKLPLYYIYGGKGNMLDLSVDAIGTLIAYADMAYNYDAMNLVVNPLEIGREIVKARKIKATKGGKALKEVFRYGGVTRKNDIYVDTAASNFMATLNDFFESKIYGRYLVDNGDIHGINVNKAAGALLKLGSTVLLGFNVLAHLANAGTGIAMLNIEAAAGEFFNARQLAKADKEYVKAMASYVGDIGLRVTKSKLALFDLMFDVRLNFKSKIKETSFLNKTILTRIFGPGILYLGLDAGDHWLYNRTAIAMALNHELLYTDPNTGKKSSISLWDALEVVPIDKNNPEAGNKLVIKDGVTNTDGSRFSIKDISEISGRMRYVNQHLFGIYNDEDSIAARRMIWGRFLLQYRDWIPAQFRYRFGSKTSNLEKGDDVEGYYRTTGRFMVLVCNELHHGERTISQVWNDLDKSELANVKRAIAEIAQFLVVAGLASLMGGADKDRPWAIRAISYGIVREKTELGALVPGFSMVSEGVKILKSPFAATNVMDDISGLSGLMNPVNYFDEIQLGDYEGHSTAYKDFMRSPLTLWYRTIKRAMSPEKAEQYFNQ